MAADVAAVVATVAFWRGRGLETDTTIDKRLYRTLVKKLIGAAAAQLLFCSH